MRAAITQSPRVFLFDAAWLAAAKNLRRFIADYAICPKQQKRPLGLFTTNRLDFRSYKDPITPALRSPEFSMVSGEF
ncbi:MAG: hypothetical protein HOP09_02250 [Hyphomicrobium sp.]|nr:hypothetical protein [Hyphomicrobium sp.]